MTDGARGFFFFHEKKKHEHRRFFQTKQTVCPPTMREQVTSAISPGCVIEVIAVVASFSIIIVFCGCFCQNSRDHDDSDSNEMNDDDVESDQTSSSAESEDDNYRARGASHRLYFWQCFNSSHLICFSCPRTRYWPSSQAATRGSRQKNQSSIRVGLESTPLICDHACRCKFSTRPRETRGAAGTVHGRRS